MKIIRNFEWLSPTLRHRITSLLLLLIASTLTCCSDKSGKDPKKVTDPNLNRTEPGLYIQLVLQGTEITSDADMLTSLNTNCGSCHNSNNPARIDLSKLPGADLAPEIERRINLSSDASGYMPLGRAMSASDTKLMTTWLRNRANPAATKTFAGYKASVLNTANGTSTDVAVTDDGRFFIDVGQQIPGTQLTRKIIITDPLGEDQVFPVVTFTIDANGQSHETITLRPRDTIAPTVAERTITASNVTETTMRVSWSPASDDHSALGLTYRLYQSTSPDFDSINQVELNGNTVGEELSTGASFTIDLSGLEPGKAYYFNVIVRDRAGNKSIYQKTQLLTRPQCAEITSYGSVNLWRDAIAKDLVLGNKSPATILGEIGRCFPLKTPAALKRIEGFALKDRIATSLSAGTFTETLQKRPPREILENPADPTSAKYWIPDNIEQIAKDKGWTAVRYKSRHAGGFDQGTPNLLMVYVPGPTYDQWLNFPLPKDDDEPPIGSPQYSRPKFGPPKKSAYATDRSLPSTFTMVTQDHPVDGKPGHVYFQMFFRTEGTSTFTPSANNNLAICASCHPNGLRAISPLGYTVREGERSLTPAERQLTSEDLRAIKFINDKMIEAAGNMSPTWGEGKTNGEKLPLYRPEHHGPVYGPAKPLNSVTRTAEYIKYCRNRTPKIVLSDIFRRGPGMVSSMNTFRLSNTENPNINPEKVINAMNCESCHNSDSVSGYPKRGPLNKATDVSQIRFKVLVDQTMPLGAHLNPNEHGNNSDHVIDMLTSDERFALMNCLEAEFQDSQTSENVVKWMTQESVGQ